MSSTKAISPESCAGLTSASAASLSSVFGRVEPEVGDLLCLEQPLGVAPGAVDVADQRRQAAQDEHHRKRIVVLVLRGDERRQKRAERELLLARLVVHRVRLVEEERHAAAARRYAELLERDAEAVFEHRVPARVASGPDGHRDAASEIDGDLSDRRLRGIDDLALDASHDRELVDRIAHVVRDRGREGFLIAEAHAEVSAHDDPAFAFGHPLELLEQHGLPDAAQARDAKVAALLGIILEETREAA